jgi:hypothetical protein
MQVEGVLERSARREDKTERLKRESVARDAVLSMYADRFGDHVGVLPRTQGRPRRSLRRRYTVDLTSQNLAFEKTDASVLGCGSSAVVYKGMLDNKPVAIKVREARMLATLAAVVQLKSCCRRRLSSSKGSPKLRARGSAYRLGVQITPRSVRALAHAGVQRHEVRAGHHDEA